MPVPAAACMMRGAGAARGARARPRRRGGMNLQLLGSIFPGLDADEVNVQLVEYLSNLAKAGGDAGAAAAANMTLDEATVAAAAAAAASAAAGAGGEAPPVSGENVVDKEQVGGAKEAVKKEEV